MQLPVLHDKQSFGAREPGPRSIEAVRVLRIGLTDRCNLRCVYCMPADGMPWLSKGELLSSDEILRVVQSALDFHGIRRFKLTGGEPTLRPDLLDLIGRIRRLRGVIDLSLTTNGVLLEDLAASMRDAGLDRVTISLDSLQPDRFRHITRNGEMDRVLRGLDRAAAAGFEQVKLNCVVMRGINDDEVADFARLTLTRDLSVRFIEYMPLGNGRWATAAPSEGCEAQNRPRGPLVNEDEVRQSIESALGPLHRTSPSSETGVGPAVMYRLAGARGRIGFISAMSSPFCDTCNRLRLTAAGVLRSCLFDGGEVDLKPILRQSGGAPPSRIARAMHDCVALKPQSHAACGTDPMSRVGG